MVVYLIVNIGKPDLFFLFFYLINVSTARLFVFFRGNLLEACFTSKLCVYFVNIHNKHVMTFKDPMKCLNKHVFLTHVGVFSKQEDGAEHNIQPILLML